MLRFDELSLYPELLSILAQRGFTNPTEIQEKAIPVLLAQEHVDFHGQAQTGTGKTLAFGLPLIQRIKNEKTHTQALVVAPTRELAVQIFDSLKPFAAARGISIFPVYGGASMYDQIKALNRGVQIVIGTPGRLNDHIRKGTLKLQNISTLILDEADIMLDMGFREEIDEILEHANPTREIWLFSATVKSGISDLMAEHMTNTQTVKVARKDTDTGPLVQQYYCAVPMKTRLQALCRFIESNPDFYGFIFCQTKILTGEIAEELIRLGYNVGALHGDLSQAQRNAVIKKFRDKQLSIVVATDVAARGIDIPNLTHVVNYSVPDDQESYVHRIGRTGRAGKTGTAITFVSRSEVRAIQSLARKFNLKIEPINVPSREHIIASRMILANDYIAHALAQPVAAQPALSELLNPLSPEELSQIALALLYDKFIKVVDSQDTTSFESTPAQAEQHAASGYEPATEVVIGVGSDDQVTRDEVMELLRAQGVHMDMITKVRVIKRKTFIALQSSVYAPTLIELLKSCQMGGRALRPALVNNEGSDQGRSGGRGRRFGGREGGRRFGGGNREYREGGREPREGGFGGRERGGYRGGNGGFSGSSYRPDSGDREMRGGHRSRRS